MSRVFNLLKFYLKTAATEKLTVEDLPDIKWDDIPGATDQEKVKYLQTEFASILQNSESPMYDIMSAIGALRYPEVTDPAAHQRFNQILRALDTLNREEKSRYDEVLKLLGGNTDLLMQEALNQFKLRYVPQIAELMKQTRLRNTQPLTNVATLTDFQAEKDALIRDLRLVYARRLTKSFSDQIDTVQKAGLSAEQIAWMLQGTRTSNLKDMPQYEQTAIRLGKEQNPTASDQEAFEIGTKILKNLQKETEKNTTTRVGNWQGEDDLMANLYLSPNEWSDKFRQLLTDPQTQILAQASLGRVRKEEILDGLGYSSVQFPQEPKDIFFSPEIPHASIDIKNLTPEQLEEQNKIKTLRRVDPYNLLLLKKILELGGFNENGNALDVTTIFNTPIQDLPPYGQDWEAYRAQISMLRREWEEFFGSDADEESLDVDELLSKINTNGQNTNWVLHALGYVAKTLCENNPSLFAQMVVDSGSASMDEIRSQMGKKVLPDTRYTEDYNLTFRSQEERSLVERMRNKFGLEVVPYPMGIPKLDGCKAAVSGFQIDFMIPADVVTSWTSGPDNQYHPTIKEKMVFIGEYFGYDRNTPRPVNEHDDEGFRDIDGQIAKITRKDGSVVEAYNGTELSIGEHYELKSRWKSMTHDVLASLSGNATVLIGKNYKDENIMDELDKNGIIYNYSSGIVRMNPMNQLKNHIPNCQIEDCQSKSFFNISPQGPMFIKTEIPRAVAFIRCCLADLDIQYAIKPALLAKDEDGNKIFNRERLYNFYIKQRQIQDEIIRNRRSRDFNRDRDFQLLDELNKVNQDIQLLSDEVKKQQNTEIYQQLKKQLLELLELAKQGTMPDSEIYKAATKLIKPWVPFTEKRAASIKNILFRIAISS